MKQQTTFPIIFLGTDKISLKGLDHLLHHPEFEVKGVVTQKAKRKGRGLYSRLSPVAQRAENLPLPVLMPDNLKDPDFLSDVKSLKARWAVLLSYGKILPPDFLSLFPERALNFHASLLPRWRGAAPVQRAIMAGDRQLGMSLQVMKAQLDTGPLIGVRAFELTEQMNAIDAFEKMDFLIKELLSDLLEYMKGHCVPVPQKEGEVIYARKIDKKESQIVWNESAVNIFNKVRALVMGPQAYTFYKGKRIKIYKAKPCFESEHEACPGQVVEIDSDCIKVACQKSTLSILRLQPESKQIMSAGDYVRGYNLKTGVYLGKGEKKQ